MPLLEERKSLAKIKAKIKANKISSKLPTKIAIRKAIMLPIVLNLPKQKNNYSFNNFYINNCKYKGWYQNSIGLEAYALHLIPSLISGKLIN